MSNLSIDIDKLAAHFAEGPVTRIIKESSADIMIYCYRLGAELDLREGTPDEIKPEDAQLSIITDSAGTVMVCFGGGAVIAHAPYDYVIHDGWLGDLESIVPDAFNRSNEMEM